MLLLCVNHNCYLYMPSWGPDLVNKFISISISIPFKVWHICLRERKTTFEIDLGENVNVWMNEHVLVLFMNW